MDKAHLLRRAAVVGWLYQNAGRSSHPNIGWTSLRFIGRRSGSSGRF
jgi:hypothetical protein